MGKGDEIVNAGIGGGGGGVGGEGGEFLDSAPRGFSPSSPSPENQPTLYDLL